MNSHAQDDGFHEIQLNGKQLVFLFMAATVVSVVIFLCGVLVGRGVRVERSVAAGDATSAGTMSTAEPTPQQPPAATRTPAGSDPTAAAPPPAAEDLTYFNRLEKKNQPPENLKPATGPPPASPRVSRAAPPAPKEPQPMPAAADPAAQGFALQVAALRERNEADAIAKRLVSKGYTAYVLAPVEGTPTVYRVRVGKFKTRREAETVASKLQQEEQFKPWITR